MDTPQSLGHSHLPGPWQPLLFVSPATKQNAVSGRYLDMEEYISPELYTPCTDCSLIFNQHDGKLAFQCDHPGKPTKRDSE